MMITMAFRTFLMGLSLGSAMVITPALGQTAALIEQKPEPKTETITAEQALENRRLQRTVALIEQKPEPKSETITAEQALENHRLHLLSQPARANDSLILQGNLASDVQGTLNSVYSFVASVKHPEEELFGTSLQPVSDIQRGQIDIPADQGLIVGGVNPNSAADRIGLKTNDILLTLGDKPLAKFDDLTAALKADTEGKAIKLHFLRKGKKESVEVKPISVVTCAPVPKVEKSFMIGVSVGPMDEVLNDQFDGKVQGLIVNEVIAGKPAEKGGIKAGDILVSIDDQPLATTEQLTEKIKSSEGKPVLVHYRRRDKIDSVKLTPEPREIPVAEINTSLRVFQLGVQAHPEMFVQQLGSNVVNNQIALEALKRAHDHDPEPRVAAIEKELEGLKRQLAEIQELIKAQGKK